MAIKSCVVCGVDFDAFDALGRPSPTKKMCSAECERGVRNARAAAKRAAGPGFGQRHCTVEGCGKEFRARSSTQKTCSLACSLVNITQVSRAHDKKRNPRKNIMKHCIIEGCGKEFRDWNGRTLTCSAECHRKVVYAHNYRNYHVLYGPAQIAFRQANPIIKRCAAEGCGKEFHAPGAALVCSPECRAAYWLAYANDYNNAIEADARAYRARFDVDTARPYHVAIRVDAQLYRTFINSQPGELNP